MQIMYCQVGKCYLLDNMMVVINNSACVEYSATMY